MSSFHCCGCNKKTHVTPMDPEKVVIGKTQLSMMELINDSRVFPLSSLDFRGFLKDTYHCHEQFDFLCAIHTFKTRIQHQSDSHKDQRTAPSTPNRDTRVLRIDNLMPNVPNMPYSPYTPHRQISSLGFALSDVKQQGEKVGKEEEDEEEEDMTSPLWNPTNIYDIQRLVSHICNRYIHINSVCQVNISNRLRDHILRQSSLYPFDVNHVSTLFDDAEREVRILVRSYIRPFLLRQQQNINISESGIRVKRSIVSGIVSVILFVCLELSSASRWWRLFDFLPILVCISHAFSVQAGI